MAFPSSSLIYNSCEPFRNEINADELSLLAVAADGSVSDTFDSIS